jgi:threonyl-tRNA synthetase
MPARFGLTYSGADNHEHTPVMIHRAMLGSYERFIGIMLEHYAGVLPLWLAPVQAIVLPVADRFNEHAAKVRDALAGKGARVELDHRSESIKRKIRDAELRKVPYMLVIGEREQQDGTVSLREHGRGDAGSVPLEEFTTRLAGELYSAALTPRKSSHRHA